MNQHARERRKPLEKAVWIEQRHFEGQRIEHGEPALLVACEAAAEQLRHIGGDLALEQIVIAELAQDLDGVVLRRGIFAELVKKRVPDFVGGAHSIHAPDEVERVLVDPVVLSRARVLKQIPGLAAIDMTGHTHMAAQPRMYSRDTVPAGTEKESIGLGSGSAPCAQG